MLLIAAALVLIAAPLALWLVGMFTGRQARDAISNPSPAWDWKLILLSTLLYTLAFNLTFFVQELFLVVPKALTPGLQPTLFHNNHGWEGEHPLASLFQGTGALATVLSGAICALWLARGNVRSTTARLLLFWMAYSGIFMALPQVVIGALSAGSDLGMAMEYLRLDATAKTIAALVALAAIPVIARWLGKQLLGMADNPAHHPVPYSAGNDRSRVAASAGDRGWNRLDSSRHLAHDDGNGDRFACRIRDLSTGRGAGAACRVPVAAAAGDPVLLTCMRGHAG
jgi:hypothetical protein